MANKSFSTIATDLAANATALAATDSNITAGEFAALAAVCNILANHHGHSLPIMKLLSDTNKALLAPG